MEGLYFDSLQSKCLLNSGVLLMFRISTVQKKLEELFITVASTVDLLL